METTQNPAPVSREIVIEDCRLLVTLGIKEGYEIVQRIPLPVGSTVGVPLRANGRAFAEAHQWLMQQLTAFQKRIDEGEAEAEEATDDAPNDLPDNTMHLPGL